MSKKKKANKRVPKPKKKSNKPLKNVSFWKQQQVLYPILGVLAITFVLFIPSLSHDFVNWDDTVNLTENSNLNGFTVQNIINIFHPETGLVIGNYNPLPIFTFAIEKALFGLNPTVFHMNNLLLHLICVFLVFRLMLKFKLSVGAAALVALLFGIHPMRVESVAWVTERKDVLFGVFYLAALFTYVRHLESQEKKRYYYLLTLGLFVVSLFSKIQAVALPLSMLAIDYWMKRPLTMKRITEKIPFFGLSLLFGILGIVFLNKEGSIDNAAIFGFVDRLFIGAYSYIVYLLKFVVPYPLSPLYPYPAKLSIWFYLAPIPVFAVLAALFYAFKKDYRAIVFGFAFFTFNVVFLLQIVGAGQGFIADRFTYIPYIGFFFIVAYAYDFFIKKKPSTKLYWQMGLGTYLLVLGFLSYLQIGIWKNSYTLWTQTIQHYPETHTAWSNRGHYFRDNNDFKNALSNYNQSIQLRPDVANTYNSRGKLYFENGQTQEGMADYSRAIERDATIAEIFVNRGAAYGSMGKLDLALKDFAEAERLDSSFKNTYFNRSMAHMNMNNFQLAIEDYTKYIELDATNPDMWYERGIAKAQLQQYEGAIQDYTQAIRLNPTAKNYYENRARVYEALGKTAEANADRQKAK